MLLTLESTIILFATLPVCVAFYLLAEHIINNRNKTIIFFAAAWFCLIIINILAALGYSTLNASYLFVRIYLFIPLGAFLIIGIDQAQREEIDYKKLVIVAILATAIVFTSQEDAFEIDIMPNGEFTLYHAGGVRIVLFLTSLYYGVLYLIFAFKLYAESPVDLKKYALINLVGAFSFGVLSAFSLLTGLSLYIPGIAEVFIGFGALCNAVAFSKEPKLGGVLPYKVSSLHLFDTNSGLSLFSHKWIKSEQEIDPNLFSGLFQGITMFAKEAVQKGGIREILLEDGVLIIQQLQNQPYASILIVSNPSLSLRRSLNTFSEKITAQYLPVLDQKIDLSQDANLLNVLTECFPYIPDYT